LHVNTTAGGKEGWKGVSSEEDKVNNIESDRDRRLHHLLRGIQLGYYFVIWSEGGVNNRCDQGPRGTGGKKAEERKGRTWGGKRTSMGEISRPRVELRWDNQQIGSPGTKKTQVKIYLYKGGRRNGNSRGVNSSSNGTLPRGVSRGGSDSKSIR